MEASMDVAISAKLGLASHQNAVPLVQRVAVTNDGSEPIEDLVLEFEPGLPFAEHKTWRIDRLARGATLDIADRNIELKEGYLADLSEGVRVSAKFSLRSHDVALADRTVELELLARNDWGGAGSMPELLAVFCTPNDPAVDKILKGASDVLRRAGRADGIDGYPAKSR